MTMSVEFTRPFDIPVDDSITLIAEDTIKAWLSWGIYKLGQEQEASAYTYGATTAGAAVDMFIPTPPYVERTVKTGAIALASSSAALILGLALALSSLY